MRLFQQKPKKWTEYTEDLYSSYITISNRPTERLKFLGITETSIKIVREAVKGNTAKLCNTIFASGCKHGICRDVCKDWSCT